MGSFQDQIWFERFCALSSEQIYSRGQSFSVQGEALNTAALIISGRAAAFSYSINGKETWLGEFRQGQFMGLTALLTKEACDIELRATSKLILRSLSHDKMLGLMKAEPSFCEALAADLAARLSNSISDLIQVNTLSVRGRICAELIRLALPIGIDPDRHIIRPSPVFVELAGRLNSSRETVSRTISQLQKQGILARSPGALIIENPKRLRGAIEYI